MKKLNVLIVLVALVFSSNAQTRISLLEEFTGETCMPCAAYNPALDYLTKQPVNTSKLIAIKWEVPIPVAPMSVNSLYLTNQAEINWRYRGISNGGYGYQAQYTSTSSVNDGILNAPTCFIDGKNQWAFGALGDHPYYLNNTVINTAASVTTPFSLVMSPSWNASFNSCLVTVTVSSSSAFTALGSLMFRLCLVERSIEFSTPPGANGETKFYDAVRKSYPVTTSGGGAITNIGSSLPSSWTAGQTQVLTITCAIPAYIMDKSQIAFVGFVQDDGDRQVYQTARTAQPSIPNDAKAEAIDIPLVVCSSTIIPSAIIKNNGPNAITALTLTPLLNGSPGTNISWTGNIAPLSLATIQLNPVSVNSGTQLCGYLIAGVSGGDVVQENNKKETTILFDPTYTPAPLSEGFESAIFPPLNWTLPSLGANGTFSLSPPTGAYGLSYNSIFYPLFVAPIGEEVELYLPPTDLIGTINSELNFDLAYQQLSSTSKDSLKVLLSSDCGATWSTIFSKGGTSMATAALSVGTYSFAPASTDWTTHTIPLVSYATSPKVLLKFKVKGDGGNGLFIDNVNLKAGSGNPTTTGITTIEQNNLNFNFYPNPANSNIVVSINATYNFPMFLSIVNSLGEIVYTKTNLSNATFTFDLKDIPAGIYFVKLETENSSSIKKLMISK